MLFRPGVPQPYGFRIAELSALLLITLSKPGPAHQKQSLFDNPDISKGHIAISLWHPRKGQI